jgi:formylglycine-generating enzyme required for sulfatase activity
MSPKFLFPSLAAVAVLTMLTTTAFADTFGTGANEFTIEFVDIGNPGNAADTTGAPNPAGWVPYVYRMGKYEISRDMITKANTAGSLGIDLQDMSRFGGNVGTHPSTGVSWNEAARFVNWLNTSEGLLPAYKFAVQPGEGGYDANANILLWESGDAGYNSANPFRNELAYYFLPSVDEWYKAAYYDPSSSGYFNYPTGSDSAPTPVASGTTAGTAVYGQSLSPGPADITLAGGLSPYGTMGQGGNVWEWEETEYNLTNDNAGSSRGLRGSGWGGVSGELRAFIRGNGLPTHEDYWIGFRVASVPEPGSITLLGCGLVAALMWWRRRK